MLSPGSRLGPYEVVAPLGAGGMGEVYRATDTKLGRDVALKLLPPAFAADPDRLARFEREAKVLASLNHPNVAHLYGFEQVALPDGTPAHLLAMELVPGEDLAERIKRGPVPVEDAIPIARQIAEALEEAHEKGIVHRDLKPANVKVTADGKVKVLDFGLAKAWSNDASGVASSGDLSQSPTLAHTGTAAGLILGTAAYMSPEQARARPVDKRADIWAFGVVVFEMLSGRRLFEGETVSDILASVLKSEPDWKALPPSTPASVRQLLQRCLERDPKLRLRDIGEARLALAGGAALGLATTATAPASPQAAPGRVPASFWLALVLVAAGSAGLTAWLQARRIASAPRPVTRLSIPLPPGQVLTGNGGPALSRDGRRIAYPARDASGTSRLYLRDLDRFEARVVPESEGAQQPFFSPDGSRVAFFARGKLMTAAAAGGAPTPIADSSAQPIGGTWGEDDGIVFAPALGSGLLRVPASGGTPKQLTRPDDGPHGYAHGRPSFLPGGRSLLYTVWGAVAGDVRGSALLSLDTGASTRVTAGIWSSRYVASGHLLLSGPRGIRAVAFDPAHPHLVNPETFVIDEVYSTPAWSDSWLAVSDTGTLAYVPGDSTLGRLAWVDREGRTTLVSEQPVSLVDPNLSPDGERIVFEDRDDNLWALDLRRGSRVRLTLDGEGSNAYPVWTRDGSRVLFASNRSGDWDIYSVPGAGGAATRLLARPGNQFPVAITPDGTILFNERSKGTAASLHTLSPDGRVTQFLVSGFSTLGGQVSPDGHAVAYVSDENGQDEVYVRPFDRPGDAAQVSTEGGSAPRWSADGKALVYRRGDTFLSASVAWTGGRLSTAEPRALFGIAAARGRSPLQAGYSVAADGRLLVLLCDPKAIPNRIEVVLNWSEELKAKVPAR